MGTIRFNKHRDKWGIDYVDAHGRRIRQLIGAGEEGKRLAKQILKQRKAEAQLGIHNLSASRTIRFDAFAEDWLARAAGRNLAPKTLESYEGMVRCHLIPAFGTMNLGAISRRDVELLLAEAKTTRRNPTPVSPKTAAYALTILKTILAAAVEDGHLSRSPAQSVKPPRPTDRADEMRALTPEEVGQLLDAAEEPWRTLYLLGVHTGLRRGELLGLRWDDVDLPRGQVRVRRSLHRFRDGDHYVVREAPLKTRHSRRNIDLSPDAIDALRVHPSSDRENDYVFRSRSGGPISPDAVDGAFRRHLAMAGLPEIRFHDLRHTHASLLIAAGVHPKAIQARLGHSSITVTMDRYGHLMPSAFAGVGERLDALLDQGNRKATNEAMTGKAAEIEDFLVGPPGFEPGTGAL